MTAQPGSYRVSRELVEPGRVERVTLLLEGRTLSWREIIAGWRGDGAMCSRFVEALRGAPFAAYFWETPPITAATVDRPFEFVTVSSPVLEELRASPRAFAAHLRPGEIATFPNLAADAVLVSPGTTGRDASYAQLGSFLREAPDAQIRDLWSTVGEALATGLREHPGRLVWVSTSGLGVPWVHVRLDSRPKYYTYAPYRSGD